MIGDEYDAMALLHTCNTLCEWEREDSVVSGADEDEEGPVLVLNEEVRLGIANCARELLDAFEAVEKSHRRQYCQWGEKRPTPVSFVFLSPLIRH
jgi:hypothetical protein